MFGRRTLSGAFLCAERRVIGLHKKIIGIEELVDIIGVMKNRSRASIFQGMNL